MRGSMGFSDSYNDCVPRKRKVYIISIYNWLNCLDFKFHVCALISLLYLYRFFFGSPCNSHSKRCHTKFLLCHVDKEKWKALYIMPSDHDCTKTQDHFWILISISRSAILKLDAKHSKCLHSSVLVGVKVIRIWKFSDYSFILSFFHFCFCLNVRIFFCHILLWTNF